MFADETPNLALETLRRRGEETEVYLRQVLNTLIDAPPRLRESIEYSLFAPGKRLRPTLALESYFLFLSPESQRPDSAPALPAAAAIELIHTFSLVHDDLPAMDDDDLRRGRPTNHKVFGDALAILAGDAMVALAFELLTRADPAIAPALVRELASATGPLGMIGGQVLDIEGESTSLNLEQLQQLHRRKTGALLTAALRMGAISAKASDAQLAAITAFGNHLGLAFQIVDDVLDVTASPAQLGKATQKDATKGKNTYPALLGLDGARDAAQSCLDAALASLTPFGLAADSLRVLARFVVWRQQ